MDFQRLIKEARIISSTNRLPAKIYEEALNRHYAYEDNLMLEEDDKIEDSDKEFVISHIQNDDYDVDNFEAFCDELYNNKRGGFLSKYTPEEFKEDDVHTYSVPGYEIGFALKPIPESDDVDIISVHNNTGIKGIADELIESAKRLGGTTLDHYDGFLSDLYSKHGFEEYNRLEWDDQYRPEDWDEDSYGKPDVVFRRLKKEED